MRPYIASTAEVELKRRSELPSPVDTGTIKVIDGVETLRAASR
jgi:hypothetical protein